MLDRRKIIQDIWKKLKVIFNKQIIKFYNIHKIYIKNINIFTKGKFNILTHKINYKI